MRGQRARTQFGVKMIDGRLAEFVTLGNRSLYELSSGLWSKSIHVAACIRFHHSAVSGDRTIALFCLLAMLIPLDEIRKGGHRGSRVADAVFGSEPSPGGSISLSCYAGSRGCMQTLATPGLGRSTVIEVNLPVSSFTHRNCPSLSRPLSSYSATLILGLSVINFPFALRVNCTRHCRAGSSPATSQRYNLGVTSARFAGRNIQGVRDPRSNLFGRAAHRINIQMRVARCCNGLLVAKKLSDDRQAEAAGRAEGRMRMPQIVKPHAFQIGAA